MSRFDPIAWGLWRSRAGGDCCAHTPIEQHEKAAIANAADRQDAMLEPP